MPPPYIGRFWTFHRASLPAAHADGPQSAALALKAAQSLKTHRGRCRQVGTLVRTTVRSRWPAISSQIFDFKAFNALPRPQAGDMAWLSDWADAVDTATKISDAGWAAAPRPEQAEQAQQRSYEAAIIAAWVFSLHFQSRLMRDSRRIRESAAGGETHARSVRGIAVMRERGIEWHHGGADAHHARRHAGAGELALISARCATPHRNGPASSMRKSASGSSRSSASCASRTRTARSPTASRPCRAALAARTQPTFWCRIVMNIRLSGCTVALIAAMAPPASAGIWARGCMGQLGNGASSSIATP